MPAAKHAHAKSMANTAELKVEELFCNVFCWFQPLKITGMKVYTHEVDQKEVIMDMNIWWVSHLRSVTPLLIKSV